MKLHAGYRIVGVADPHDKAVVGLGDDVEHVGAGFAFDDETVMRGKEIGACFFIAKPFKMETIKDCLEKIFKGDP